MLKLDIIPSHRQQLKLLWVITSLRLFNFVWTDLKFLFFRLKYSTGNKIKIHLNFCYSSKFFNKERKNRFHSLYANKNRAVGPSDNYNALGSVFFSEVTGDKLAKLFNVFVNTNLAPNFEYFRTASSWGAFFLRTVNRDNGVICLRKFFTKWKMIYYLLFNLFYYNIKLLVFGSSFFKKELLSINWSGNKHLLQIWRYVSPFFHFKFGQIVNYGKYIFKVLKLKGLHVSLVVDVFYHSKTLFYLKTNTFYTVGVVPLNYTPHNVDFAVPSSADGVFTQLFFIRFVLKIQKTSKMMHFTKFKDLWFNFFSYLL